MVFIYCKHRENLKFVSCLHDNAQHMKGSCLMFVVKYFYWCTDQHSALCWTYRFTYQIIIL